MSETQVWAFIVAVHLLATGEIDAVALHNLEAELAFQDAHGMPSRGWAERHGAGAR